MAKDDQDEFLGGGGLALRFAEVGDNYTLTVTEEPDVVALRDFDDESVTLTWPDGRVKKQMIIYGRLTEDSPGWTDDDEDDGDRRLFVKGYMTGALKDALRKAKARRVTVGGTLYVEFAEEGEAKSRKHQPPKLYNMEWTPGKAPASKKETSGFENDEVDEEPAPRRRRSAPVEPRAQGRKAPVRDEETVTGRSAARQKAARAAAARSDDAEDADVPF